MISTTFKSEGFTLAGHLFKPANPKKQAFLMIQGWQGHENISAAQVLATMNYPVMTYDMRGHGRSEGNIDDFSRTDFINDSVVAYDFLQQQVEVNTEIGVIGSSFGAYTAALLTQRRPVNSLSLRVPANYPDEKINVPQEAQRHDTRDYLEWRKRRLKYQENLALQAVHDFSGPIQIIEAGVDEVVSHQTVLNYKQAVHDENLLSYSIMDQAPHRLANDKLQKEYERLLREWSRVNIIEGQLNSKLP